MSNALTVANVAVRQDSEGRFNLNDLHNAAGGNPKDKPSEWLRYGKAGGTFVVKELVYAYAMWISPAFHLKVIRAYDQMATQPQVPQSFADALRLAAEQAEQLEQITNERDTILSTTTRHLTSLARHIRQYPDVNSTKEKDVAAHWLCASL